MGAKKCVRASAVEGIAFFTADDSSAKALTLAFNVGVAQPLFPFMQAKSWEQVC